MQNRSHLIVPIQKKVEQAVAFIKDLPVEIEHACANDVEKGYKQVRIFVEDETRVGLMPSSYYFAWLATYYCSSFWF